MTTGVYSNYDCDQVEKKEPEELSWWVLGESQRRIFLQVRDLANVRLRRDQRAGPRWQRNKLSSDQDLKTCDSLSFSVAGCCDFEWTKD